MNQSISDKSPFLLCDLLREYAVHSERSDLLLLDASRGAANWQLRRVLNAWHALGLYAARAPATPPNDGEVALALDPKADHWRGLCEFAADCADGPTGLAEGANFLLRACEYLGDQVLPEQGRRGIAYELAEAAAGRRYPSPPTLDFIPPVLARYLAPLLFGGDVELARQFRMICCEGATTGLAMVAGTLVRNGLIAPGDRIAVWWPTYEPLCDLVECQLDCEIVPIKRDPAQGWAVPPTELRKLDDPRVRLVVTVSPGNPLPVVTDPRSLDALERAVEHRPDLLVLSDYVYTHFLDEPVETEIARMPLNTIGVYSVSKDFGLAGMRVGVLLIHPEGAAEGARAELEAAAGPDARYGRHVLESHQMSLAERIIADSRGVSFTHMSGLSTPLQALLCLCAVYDLIEPEAKRYFAWIRGELAARIAALYEGLDIALPSWASSPNSRYSTIVNLEEIARARGGEELVQALTSQTPWELMVYLAREWRIVLTPGEGFGGGEWSVRVCFPSVSVEQARELGRRLATAVEAFARTKAQVGRR